MHNFLLFTFQSTLLRYQALVTLKKSITTAKRAITDATTKDILKQSRNFLTDKALPIQRASADVSSVFLSLNSSPRAL